MDIAFGHLWAIAFKTLKKEPSDLFILTLPYTAVPHVSNQATCRDLWMEVVLKLVAVAVVQAGWLTD